MRNRRDTEHRWRRAASTVLLATATLAGGLSLAHAQSRQGSRERLEAQASEIIQQRSQLDANLRETARLVQDSEGRLTAIEERQKELTEQETSLRATLSERHGTLAVLLGAMQRMGRNPPPVVITRREDALRMVRSAMILARAFPELSEQALALAGRITELERVRSEIDAEAVRLRAETARLNDQRTRIAQLMEAKRATLAELQPQLDAARREAERVAGKVKDLNELISGLPRGQPAQSPVQQAGAPTGTMPTPAVAAAPPQEPAAPSGVAPAVTAAGPTAPVVAPAAPVEQRTVVAELLPQSTNVAAMRPVELKPATPFVRTKGGLPMPAQGKRVLAFGDRTQYGAASKGIVIETRYAAQIVSPAEGTVVYAGAFRTFGQLLIINAHDGYHILLAGLSQIDVQVGQFVLSGEPVGSMSPPPRSAQDKTKGNAPVLYVEFRKDNQPINPDPWWAARSRKVQG